MPLLDFLTHTFNHVTIVNYIERSCTQNGARMRIYTDFFVTIDAMSGSFVGGSDEH